MNECYIELSIPFYPLIKPVEEFLDNWPENRMDKLIDISYINPVVVEYFNSYEIKIMENFILWKWITKTKQSLLKKKPLTLFYGISFALDPSSESGLVLLNRKLLKQAVSN